MRDLLRYTIIIILSALLGAYLFHRLRPCDVETVTEVRYDTTTVTVTKEKPIPYYVTDTLLQLDTVYLTKTKEVDTAAILADYRRYRFYSDTMLSNEIEIKFGAEVSRNRLIRYDITTTNRRPIMQLTKHYHTTAPIGVGGIVYYAPNYAGVAAGVSYNIGGWDASLYYDPFNSAVFVGAEYTIKLW